MGETTCINEWRTRIHRVPVDVETAISKRRSSTPHIWEMESIARRGC